MAESQERMLSILRERVPDYALLVNDGSPESVKSWTDPLSTGKALELLAGGLLLAAWREAGGRAAFPKFFRENPGAFLLRNEIPTSFVGRPGHASPHDRWPTGLRFHASLLPRAILSKNESSWCLFREGVPTHLLEYYMHRRRTYALRPDWAFTPGTVSVETVGASSVSVTWTQPGRTQRRCILAVGDYSEPVIREFDYEKDGSHHLVSGIAEVTYRKRLATLERQLGDYRELFRVSSDQMIYFTATASPPPKDVVTARIDIARSGEGSDRMLSPPIRRWITGLSRSRRVQI